jgi:hypothetical protein
MDYIKLYEQVKNTGLPNYQHLSIPVDINGVDIFKSHERQWKIQNGFSHRFFELIEVINACNENNLYKHKLFYDFKHFIFPNVVRFKDVKFLQHINLEKACFDEGLIIRNCQFDSIYALGAVFKRRFVLERGVNLTGLYLNDCVFDNFCIEKDVIIKNYAHFERSHFNGTFSVSGVVFDCDTRFTDCIVKMVDPDYEIRFEDIEISDASFRNAQFDAEIVFRNIKFLGYTDFTNTRFNNIANFDNFSVTHELLFRSTNSKQKLFDNQTYISFEDYAVSGKISFENVKFNNIFKKDRNRLHQLAKVDKVAIGKGCIKYMCVSTIRVIETNVENQNLIKEFANSFASFFTYSKGIKLGIEIMYSDANRLEFFYFSDDEKIDPRDFEKKLGDFEIELFNPVFAKSNPSAIGAANDNNNLDNLEFHLATNYFFERIGLKIAKGKWFEHDTAQLLNSCRFSTNSTIQMSNLPEDTKTATIILQNDLGIEAHFLHNLFQTAYSVDKIFNTPTQLANQNFMNLKGEVKSFREEIVLLILCRKIEIALEKLKKYFEEKNDSDKVAIVLGWAAQFGSLQDLAQYGRPADDIRLESQRISSNMLRFTSTFL